VKQASTDIIADLVSKTTAIKLTSKEEKDFAAAYVTKLNAIQRECKTDLIFYTKISMKYAIKNKLLFLNLVFHPLSLSSRKYYIPPSKPKMKNVLEKIILAEIEQSPNLTKDELLATIKHFRALEKKEKRTRSK